MVNLSNLLTYDIETYPNIFTFVGKHEPTNNWVCFEISERRNDADQFANFLIACRDNNVSLVGYNNVGFDYPVIHRFMMMYPNVTCWDLFLHADWIINGDRGRFDHLVKPWEVVIPQLDLYKVHHFDNIARATALKTLEFNMRSENIEDLPFPPGQPVPIWGFDPLIKYNGWDTEQTSRFLKLSSNEIEFRRDMSLKLGKDCFNMNDVKIGKEVFVKALEEAAPGSCYENKKPRQTHRPQIALRDVLLPYLRFEQSEFVRIANWFYNQVITETKGVFKDVSCTVKGFTYDFGLGGIHGSIESQIVNADDEYTVIDYDVTSYYPSLAISNTLYPAHLGPVFCKVYQQLFLERKNHKKGTAENAALKLAMNGTYGASNDKYSPFFDPQFTMAITINGQLSLCMLAEQLIKIPNCSMVQINTDGLTIKLPRTYSDTADNIVKWWEGVTALNMERADYSKMCIRDVNNYIAVGVDGKVKRKGAYAYGNDLGWHQKHSHQVIAKAAEQALVYGKDIVRTVLSHDDKMDFLIVTKVPRSSKLLWGEEQVQNICRYLVTKSGKELTKVMPPLKGKTEPRRIGINKTWNVTLWNNLEGFHYQPDLDIDYLFYVDGVKKLVEPLL